MERIPIGIRSVGILGVCRADGDAIVSDDDDNSDVDDQYGDKEEAAPYLEGGGCPTAGNQPRNQVCGLAEREHLETDSEIEKLETQDVNQLPSSLNSGRNCVDIIYHQNSDSANSKHP